MKGSSTVSLDHTSLHITMHSHLRSKNEWSGYGSTCWAPVIHRVLVQFQYLWSEAVQCCTQLEDPGNSYAKGGWHSAMPVGDSQKPNLWFKAIRCMIYIDLPNTNTYTQAHTSVGSNSIRFKYDWGGSITSWNHDIGPKIPFEMEMIRSQGLQYISQEFLLYSHSHHA